VPLSNRITRPPAWTTVRLIGIVSASVGIIASSSAARTASGLAFRTKPSAGFGRANWPSFTVVTTKEPTLKR
jgi:hypothetical protein